MTTKERRLKDSAQRAKDTLPIACSLSVPELAERRHELMGEVFGDALGVRDLEDGYEFAFAGNAARLVELVEAERACCSFFAFELHFEPGGGRILLRVRGPEGTKEFVAVEMGGSEDCWAGTNAEPER